MHQMPYYDDKGKGGAGDVIGESLSIFSTFAPREFKPLFATAPSFFLRFFSEHEQKTTEQNRTKKKKTKKKMIRMNIVKKKRKRKSKSGKTLRYITKAGSFFTMSKLLRDFLV